MKSILPCLANMKVPFFTDNDLDKIINESYYVKSTKAPKVKSTWKNKFTNDVLPIIAKMKIPFFTDEDLYKLIEDNYYD